MNDWVPFHRSLMKGRKRALPRATRFIFLELCSEAREGGGIVELAPGLSLGEAVLDILGGSRKEVHQAVVSLVTEQMIDVESQPGFIVIPSWDRWKMKDLTNADRQARWRERKRNAESNGGVTAPSVTKPLPDQIRRDQRREEEDHHAVDHQHASTADEVFAAESAIAARAAEEARARQNITPASRVSAPPRGDFSLKKMGGRKP